MKTGLFSQNLDYEQNLHLSLNSIFQVVSLLAVGTIGLDLIETPFSRTENVLGGSVTYIALAARFFAEPVGVVAVVGGDFPPRYRRLLEESGIDLEGLETDPDGATFAWGGRYQYDLNQRDTLYTDLNVLATFNPVVPSTHRSSRIICLGNLDPATQLDVLEQVTAPHLVVCDTMNYWIGNSREQLHDLLPRVDCLVINDSEARQLAGEPNLQLAARKVRAMGPDILVIKKGEHGAMLFMDDTVFVVPAYPLEDIQDPTGAGDTFMGAFAGSLSKERTIHADAFKRAIVYGSSLASFCVEAIGPDRLLQISSAEIQQRAEAFQNITSIPHLQGSAVA